MSARTESLGRQLADARATEKRIFAELRESVIEDRKAGERATDIIKAAGVALQTIYRWFNEADNAGS